eukprot:scpid48939/ scgid21499/ Inhibitor of growth protein 1
MEATSTRSYSSVYGSLEDDAKKRYRDKLDRIGGPNCIDPYLPVNDKLLSANPPSVEYPDVYNYLVNAPSPHTRESLKAYKSLDGYKYLVAGWVGTVSCFATSVEERNIFFVTARVRHSQSVSAEPVRPWIAAEKSGAVLGAHCTCMAGLGEACSHVAAVLFWLDARSRLNGDVACTSAPCQWLEPGMKQVEYKRVVDIDFASPGQKFFEHGAPKRTHGPKPAIKPPTDHEFAALFSSLNAAHHPKPAILSILPEFCDQFVPALATGCPPLLTDLYDESLLSASYEALLERCEELFVSISVSAEEATCIESASRDQAKSKAWFDYRAGRVTASRFKAAARSDVSQPSISLIKTICYPHSVLFSSKATRWGCDHEDEARRQYIESHHLDHRRFAVSDSGLVVNPEWPHLGASPDGRVSCQCCGDGILEIKCPFSCRSSDLADSAESAKFCLEKTGPDSKLQLRRSHAYHYQIQAQLLVCKSAYCDFIVWNEKEVFVERITPDKKFIAEAVQSVTDFYRVGVMPELAGKWFTKTFDAVPLEDRNASTSTDGTAGGKCYCNGKQDGEMVMCGRELCSRKHFHLSCLKLKQKPKRKWYCPDCRRLRASAKATGAASSSS